MKLLGGLTLWFLLFVAVTALTWRATEHQVKVYLLILYNAIFLSGVFWLYPILKSGLN
jgi:hypothetical protein